MRLSKEELKEVEMVVVRGYFGICIENMMREAKFLTVVAVLAMVLAIVTLNHEDFSPKTVVINTVLTVYIVANFFRLFRKLCVLKKRIQSRQDIEDFEKADIFPGDRDNLLEFAAALKVNNVVRCKQILVRIKSSTALLRLSFIQEVLRTCGPKPGTK